MLPKFTPDQARAIAHRQGNLQLIACAGSGKTEVLANRVAGLLDPKAADPCLPRNIVAFTFTEKAAGELKERITRRVEEQHGPITGMAEMFVGTIHAFCLDLLQNEIPAFLKYGVLNEVQQVTLEIKAVDNKNQRTNEENKNLAITVPTLLSRSRASRTNARDWKKNATPSVLS